MNNNEPYVLVGNALSSMIAAVELADAGHQIMIVNGTNNWGGHFVTLNFDGINFDAGMVLHEFTSYNTQADVEDISTYNAALRIDTGRFCKTVEAYVARYQQTHEVDAIQMYVDGQYYDDLLIANALTALNAMPFAEQVKNELLTLLADAANSQLHASKKHNTVGFDQQPLEPVSLANHGATLHARIFEPFCKKLLNIGTKDVSALYHRVPWLPLFYPETLLSYLENRPQALPSTIFSYPDQGGVGDLAAQLKQKIFDSNHIQVINAFPTQLKLLAENRYELSFNDQASITTTKLAWSSSPSDLLKVLGETEQIQDYDKASFTLVFARIPTSKIKLDFSVLSIADPSLVSYRISNQTRCANADDEFQRLVIELNYDYLAEKNSVPNPQELQNLITNELITLGIIAEAGSLEWIKAVDLKKALVLPSTKNIKAFENEVTAVKNIVPTIELLANASGFSSSSFNHQVLQGLKLAQKWSQI
jgi:hypothetical protein